jgi:CSLREA domain-containing protein
MFRQLSRGLVLAVVLLAVAAQGEGARAGNVTYVVNTVVDGGDGSCDPSPGQCTLRDAISEANFNIGADVITFDAAAFPPNGSGGSIGTVAPLPAIDATDGITIDGTGRSVVIHDVAENGRAGLIITTPSGTPLKNVTLRKITVQAQFFAEGIVICPGASEVPSTYACPSNPNASVTNVTIQNVVSLDHDFTALRIKGSTVSNITINSSFFFNSAKMGSNPIDGRAVEIQAFGGTLSDVTFTNNSIFNNANGSVEIVGTRVRDMNISDNTVTGPAVPVGFADGLRIGFGEDLSFVDINRNELSDLDNGLIVYGNNPTSDIVRLNVKNNMIDDVFYGIYIQTFAVLGDVVVEANEVSRARGEVVRIEGQHGAGNVVANNYLHNNIPPAIRIAESMQGPPYPTVRISRNRTVDNTGIGIDLVAPAEPSPLTPNDAGDGDQGPNKLLNFPVLTSDNGITVNGTACANCLIELFLTDNDLNPREGREFLADATADGTGAFSVRICDLGLSTITNVNATATDESGNTSEFSDSRTLANASGACPSATPAPVTSAPATATATPEPGEEAQGDLDCDGEITPLDALLILLFLEDLDFEQDEPCPDPDDDPSEFAFGDVNCDGIIDELDAVAILAYFADVPQEPTSGCPPVGEEI